MLKEFKENEFQNGIKAYLNVVMFTAKWCTPCVTVKSYINKLSENYRTAKFYIVDIEQEIDFANNYNIKQLPTIILIKNSREIARITGNIQFSCLQDLVIDNL